MLRILGIVVAVLVAVLAGVLLVAAGKPDTFRVERATRIAAPAERIFPLINDFRQWKAWSPWEEKDPAMQRTYGATTSGTGAVYAWSGDSQVGEGRMEIVESVPPSRIGIDLDFVKPMEAHNRVEFVLEPEGDMTTVRWSMAGSSSLPTKVIQVFMDMDAMVGADFEAGLADLKAAAER